MYDEVTDCRICMDSCDTSPPCACKDHVHPACLQKWITVSGNRQCEICQTPYPNVIDEDVSFLDELDDYIKYSSILGILLGVICVFLYTFYLNTENWFVVVLPVNAFLLVFAPLSHCHLCAVSIAGVSLVVEYLTSSFNGREPLQAVIVQSCIMIVSIWRECWYWYHLVPSV